MENNGNTEKSVKTNYIFIDYENVQPSSFHLTDNYPFKVILFLGNHQTKIPVDLAMAMQELGSNGEYIKIEGNGKNALDFHLSFYLGKFFEQDPNGYFHIISKDSGFDLLIKHLKSKKVLIQRHEKINDIPVLKVSNSKSSSEKVESVIEFLISRGNAKPRKVSTLSNAISTLFMKKIDVEEIDKIIKELNHKGFIRIEDTKVHYKLTGDKS